MTQRWPSKMPKNKSQSRQHAERAGRVYEFLATLYLYLKLYHIRARRFKTPMGEIDIIAQRGDVIAFIEVKYRKTTAQMGDALQAVNQRRIVRAAQLYLAKHPDISTRTLRFDVIFLAPLAWPRHVMQAFDGE